MSTVENLRQHDPPGTSDHRRSGGVGIGEAATYYAGGLLLFVLVAVVATAARALGHGYLGAGLYDLLLQDLVRALDRGLLLSLGLLAALLAQGAVARLLGRPGATTQRRLALVLVFAAPVIAELPAIDRALRTAPALQRLVRDSPFLQRTFDAPFSRLLAFAILAVALAAAGVALAAAVTTRARAARARRPSPSGRGWRRPALTLAAVALLALAGLHAALALRRHHARPDGPNVLLITIDTVRVDRLGSFGERRPVSPHIDRLGREGLLYRHGIAQGSWTLPSMASLHSAQYPWQHGAQRWDRRLGARVLTLAERLRNRFYRTIGVVSNEFVGRTYGFEQGFETFDETYMMGHDGVSSPGLTARAIRYLRAARDDRFFLWVHYFDPHYDWVHHPQFGFAGGYRGRLPAQLEVESLRAAAAELDPADRAYIEDVFAEEIAFTDASIGELMAELEALELRDETLVVLTADHGEEFFERGRIGHGKYVYQELIHVPLIIYHPGRPELHGRQVDARVEVRSIYRTILEACGIEAADVGGRNLLEIATGRQRGGPVLSEGTEAWAAGDRRVAILLERWKLIRNESTGAEELFDLERDPLERVNLIDSDPELREVAATLRRQLARLASPSADPDAAPARLDEETRERLRALGYLQ